MFNRGFTQFAIKTKQVGSSIEGDKSGCVDSGLHEVRNAPSTITSYIQLM